MQTTIQAIDAADHGERLKTAIAYYFVFVALGATGAILGPTLTPLAQRSGVDLAQISYVLAASSFGYLVGSRLSARLFDHLRGHPIMAVAAAVLAILECLVPSINLVALFAVVFFFAGLCSAVLDVGPNTLLLWLYRGRVTPYMNALHFFFGVGSFISPVIVAQSLIWTGSVNLSYVIVALICLPAIPLLLRLPSPPHLVAPEHRATVKVDYRLVAIFTAIFFLYTGSEIGFGSWVASYVTALNLATPEAAALLTSAFWGALTAGRLLAIPVAMRVSTRTILIVDLAGSLASIALVVFFPTSLVAVWIGAIGAGLMMASAFPTLMSFSERLMQTTAGVTSWFFVGTGASGVIFPLVIGRLIGIIGPTAAMDTILAALVILIALFALLLASTNSKGVR